MSASAGLATWRCCRRGAGKASRGAVVFVREKEEKRRKDEGAVVVVGMDV